MITRLSTKEILNGFIETKAIRGETVSMFSNNLNKNNIEHSKKYQNSDRYSFIIYGTIETFFKANDILMHLETSIKEN